MKKKSNITLVILGLMLLSIPVVAIVGLNTLTKSSSGKSSTEIIKERKQVGAFHAVNVSSGINVIYAQRDTFSVEIETNANVMGNIEAKVDDGTLTLRMKNGMTGFFKGNTSIKAYVSAPMIDNIAISSGSNFSASQLTNHTALTINASSGSGVDCDTVSTGDCNADFSSGSRCTVKQMNAKNVSVDASSGSNAKFNINDAASVKANASSGSGIELTGKTGALSADASGGANINAAGLTYQTINSNTSGGGSVSKK